MSSISELSGVIAEHVRAVNAGDLDAIVATFADDALVNDNRREIRGRDAIRGFIAHEIVGDHVRMEVTEVIELPGMTLVRAAYDGTYDKTNLPDPLMLTHYLTVHDDRIDAEIIVFNQPSPY